MAKHTQRNIAFGVFGLIIVGAGTFLFLGGIPSGEFEFELPVQARLLTSQELQGFEAIEAPFGASVATGITCKVKQTTIVVGVNANNQIVELARIESSGIGGSPFTLLAISSTTTPEGNVLSHFQVEPKIFCSTAGELPIEVFVSKLRVTTFGSFTTFATGSVAEVLQRQNVFSSPLLMFGQGQPEQRLNQFIIKATDLELGLPDEDLSVLYTFDITGVINVSYRDFPALTYQIPITFGDLDTEFTVNVDKGRVVTDSDGDGIPDNVDLCPFSAEDFDNFEDGDGCPESGSGIVLPPPTCVFGEILQNNVCVEDCRVTDCSPKTCDEGNVTACETECINSGGQLLLILGHLTCLNVPECNQNEDLILRNGNEFVCVPKTGTGDADGDGIIDALDQCPNLAEDLDGFEDEDGCPETGTGDDCPAGQTLVNNVCVEKPSEGNLEDKVIEGDIVTLTTVRFTDNTFEFAIGSTATGASIQLPNLSQQISELVPAELIGTLTEGEGKSIEEISIEVFYFNNISPSLLTVESRSLELILTVDESSVSSATSVPIQFTGSLGTGDLSPQSGQVSPLGTGISLGIVRVSADNIVTLGEDANIGIGQKKDADLIFSISGFINFKDGDERKRFLLTNTLITFKSVDIDNQFIPIAQPQCLETQLEVVNAQTGEITCITPPPETPTCFSSERPQPVGYPCSPEDVITFCSGDRFNCTEKDLDNDGVPDHRDDCRDRTKADLIEDRLEINGSDPDDGCRAIQMGVGCNPLIQSCTPRPEPPPPEEPPLCSEENPEKCIIPPEQFLLLVIAGVVIAIVVGVALIIRSRRAQVFGA